MSKEQRHDNRFLIYADRRRNDPDDHKRNSRPASLFRYSNIDERELIADQLIKKHLLRKDTPPKSGMENVINETLLYNCIPTLYEPFKIFTGYGPKGGKLEYTMDHLLHHNTINGNAVIFETHGSDFIGLSYLQKLDQVRKMLPVHIILVSTEFKDGATREGIGRTKVMEHVDDFWSVSIGLHKAKYDFEMNLKYFLDFTKKNEDSMVGKIMERLRKPVADGVLV